LLVVDAYTLHMPDIPRFTHCTYHDTTTHTLHATLSRLTHYMPRYHDSHTTCHNITTHTLHATLPRRGGWRR
jgi:hypothetical protein